MRKILVTILLLLSALTVPATAALDAACRLAHAQAEVDVADHHHAAGQPDAGDGHAMHAQADQTIAAHAPAHPDQSAPVSDQPNVPCCPMFGPSVAAPADRMTIAAWPISIAGSIHRADHRPLLGQAPPPALGPPRG